MNCPSCGAALHLTLAEQPVKSVTPPEIVLTFPTVGNPKEWFLTAQKVSEYAVTYPAVDVKSECQKALQWCIDNPAKRKTARGMPAFLNRWLGKEQDRGGIYRKGGSNAGQPSEYGRNIETV